MSKNAAAAGAPRIPLEELTTFNRPKDELKGGEGK